MDQIPLQLDREGIKEREDGERGEGRLFEGGDCFKYFHQRGAIIQGMAIIRGNTLVTRHNKLQTITNLAVIACKLGRLTIYCGGKNKRLLAV